MYNYQLHQNLQQQLSVLKVDTVKKDNDFYTRFVTNLPIIHALFREVYGGQTNADALFNQLTQTIAKGYLERSAALRKKDADKLAKGNWFTSNQLAGMSLYVDRFCSSLDKMESKLDYVQDLGINLLHLMPLFQSPPNESDGGYAVSDFRAVDERFGTIDDLRKLQQTMQERGMYLMLDIVLNHTSYHHEWAKKAKAGDAGYQQFYYMYDDRQTPDVFEQTMPEIFPESSPGSFSYVPECNKWVMTVFHHYQWDLNYSNPAVFIAMLDTILFYANLGVDILRIDAPAFIWKQIGTTCQNLPQAHTLLRLIKQCVQVAAPGMALLGEAIVAPDAIMEYFGTGMFAAHECDFAYNATMMALQWDALATGDIRVMQAAQPVLSRKPAGGSWITYTRCHDDIGLGFDDYMIQQAGFNPYQHRQFLKNFYSGKYDGSPARGALFSSNPKTGDARISGSLASLCGLEAALEKNNTAAIDASIHKIILMQAMSCFIGGLPMLFYGDEVGYTNDYSYLNDDGKSYDNRWMHRPLIDWTKNEKVHEAGTVENRVFAATQRLLAIRKQLDVVADNSRSRWLHLHNMHVAAIVHESYEQCVYCLFNFSQVDVYEATQALPVDSNRFSQLYEHYAGLQFNLAAADIIRLAPYSFMILEAKP